MGRHSAPEKHVSVLGELCVRRELHGHGRHGAEPVSTATGVIRVVRRRPITAAIAAPAVLVAGLTAGGVALSQDDGPGTATAQGAVVSPVSPLHTATQKAQKVAESAKKATVAELQTPEPSPSTTTDATSATDSGSSDSSVPAAGRNTKASGQSGSCEASTYGAGDGTAGGPTASGETFDPSKLTAAHKTLPLGSVVKVTASNGKSVTVRINDRGPYVAGRCLDLSTAAMSRLGGDGVIQVRWRVL